LKHTAASRTQSSKKTNKVTNGMILKPNKS
jgi:hypothetical protein